MSPALLDLLGRSMAFDAEYGAQLTSHLSMALIAMDGLGASGYQMESFFLSYSSRLRLQGNRCGKITGEVLSKFLGTHNHHADLTFFFADEIGRYGREAVLRKYLRSFMNGIGSCGFHGLIRTASGVEAGHDGEIAQGLALWANGYTEFGVALTRLGTRSPSDLLRELHQRERLRCRDLRVLPIAQAMLQIDAEPDFRNLVAAVSVEGLDIGQIAQLAASVYAVRPDFASLHLITATHALRIASPYIEEVELLTSFFIGFCAIYVQVGAPLLPSRRRAIKVFPTWKEISERAINSLDDHIIKIVYSCTREYDAYKDCLYRWLAARAVGLDVDQH